MSAPYGPDIVPSIDEVLSDPAVRDWVKTQLQHLLNRDCLDAARDAALLAAVLAKRCDTLLGVDRKRP